MKTANSINLITLSILLMVGLLSRAKGQEVLRFSVDPALDEIEFEFQLSDLRANYLVRLGQVRPHPFDQWFLDNQLSLSDKQKMARSFFEHIIKYHNHPALGLDQFLELASFGLVTNLHSLQHYSQLSYYSQYQLGKKLNRVLSRQKKGLIRTVKKVRAGCGDQLTLKLDLGPQFPALGRDLSQLILQYLSDLEYEMLRRTQRSNRGLVRKSQLNQQNKLLHQVRSLIASDGKLKQNYQRVMEASHFEDAEGEVLFQSLYFEGGAALVFYFVAQLAQSPESLKDLMVVGERAELGQGWWDWPGLILQDFWP